MKKMLSKYPNLGEINYFDDIKDKILNDINSKYIEFHSGINFLPKIADGKTRDDKKDSNGVKAEKLKLSRKEKFLEESLFY